MSQIAPSYIQIFLFQSAAGFRAESSLCWLSRMQTVAGNCCKKFPVHTKPLSEYHSILSLIEN